MSKDLLFYQDEYGMIGNRDLFTNVFDFGDSAQRNGMCLIAFYVSEKRYDAIVTAEILTHYLKIMNGHEISLGIYIRHPGPGWWSDIRTMSRDQFKPLIISMGFYNDTPRLKRLLSAFLKRGMFCQNTIGNWDDTKTKLPDFAGTSVWSNFIRAFKCKWLYPFLVLCDVGLLLNTIIRIYKANCNYDDVGDDLNLCMDFIQSKQIMSTPISWLARKLYFTMRSGYGNINPAQYAFDWYFRQPETPPMNEVFRPILENLK